MKKTDHLLDALGEVRDDYIADADQAPVKRGNPWIKWGAVAACLAVAVFAGYRIVQQKSKKIPCGDWETQDVNTPQSQTGKTVIGGIARDYADTAYCTADSALIFPWEYRTTVERYTDLAVNGTTYASRGKAVDRAELGEQLGTFELAGFDSITEEEHSISAAVYAIAGVSQARMLAAELEGEYIVFQQTEYAPPKTFGEMLDAYSLAENLHLSQFLRAKGYNASETRRLSADGSLWEILETCRSAPFVEDEMWTPEDRENLQFTATAETLGVSNHALCLTADGYLWTNLFDYAYLYNIGAETAGKLIDAAMQNSEPAEPQPYPQSLAGTLVSVDADWLVIDDTVLCKDAKDGMQFRVSMKDLRIRRHIEYEGIQAGGLVILSFDGDITQDAAGYTVHGAYDLQKAVRTVQGIATKE